MLGLIAFANPAQALTNLVKNGGFETNSGPGFIFYGHPITDWTLINISGSGSSVNAVNTLSQLSSNPYNSITPIALWGVSQGYVNDNGFRNSSNGGYFIIADGDSGYYSQIRQTITGLIPSNQYELSFEYAFAQAGGFDGDTNQKWTVTFGSQAYETPAVSLPSHGFDAGPGTSGWQVARKTFTATAASQALTFLAIGAPGVPPMSLLDGVSLIDVTPPPPPASVPGPVPLLGLGATLAWSRRLRQRTQPNSLR